MYVGADALIGPMVGLFGEQALQYRLTEYLPLTIQKCKEFKIQNVTKQVHGSKVHSSRLESDED